MTGLLYRDFMLVKGHILCILVILQLLLITVLRFAFKDSVEWDGMLLALFTLFLFIMLITVLFYLDIALFRMDRKSVVNRYLFSLPVSKKQYVSEKYVFMLIAVYAFISITMFESMICRLFCVNVSVVTDSLFSASAAILSLQKLLPSIGGMILFILGIEYVFMFALGFEKGSYMKTALLIILFMAGVVYMLFGNLDLLDQWDLLHILQCISTHPEISILLSTLPIFCGGGCYLLSYLISVRCFVRKEVQADA